MSIKKEMTKALFQEETLNKVQQMLTGEIDREIFPLENYDMMFRLFHTSAGSINLEVIANSSPVSSKKEKLEGFGDVQSEQRYKYCKPIGFFTKEKNSVKLFVLKEFEEEADVLKISNHLPTTFSFNKLSLKENAIIAAFSIETVMTALQALKEKQNSKDQSGIIPELDIWIPEHAQNMQHDKSLISNGLKVDLLMSFDGYPQSYLDDKYNFKGAIGAYQSRPEGRINIAPVAQLEAAFDKLQQMSLLSAYKRI